MDKQSVPGKTITVVTGFTRCGTSLMMRMLHVGGISAYADNLQSYETGDVTGLPGRCAWLEKAQGKAVKILEPLHYTPPKGLDYRFILMVRNAREQAKSQIKFLRATGVAVSNSPATRRKLQDSLIDDLPKMIQLLQSYQRPLLVVSFEGLIKHPHLEAIKISEFCGGLNYDLMAQQVQQRQPECLPHLMELSMV